VVQAWDGAQIWFQLGQGRENVLADDGRRGTRIDSFISVGNDQWLIEESCEELHAMFTSRPLK
jgi:hypothetical protein